VWVWTEFVLTREWDYKPDLAKKEMKFQVPYRARNFLSSRMTRWRKLPLHGVRRKKRVLRAGTHILPGNIITSSHSLHHECLWKIFISLIFLDIDTNDRSLCSKLSVEGHPGGSLLKNLTWLLHKSGTRKNTAGIKIHNIYSVSTNSKPIFIVKCLIKLIIA
jgi:hypothetical protein